MGYMNHEEPYSDAYLSDILSSVKTIAMVGASPDKTKFSYGVLRVLHESGFPWRHQTRCRPGQGVLPHALCTAAMGRLSHRQPFRPPRDEAVPLPPPCLAVLPLMPRPEHCLGRCGLGLVWVGGMG